MLKRFCRQKALELLYINYQNLRKRIDVSQQASLFQEDVQATEYGSGIAPRNQTLSCSKVELDELSNEILRIDSPVELGQIANRVVQGDVFDVLPYLPEKFVDLLILDPPYNLSKNYNGRLFKEKSREEYQKWFESLVDAVIPTLKSQATIYVCSDWRTSTMVFPVLERKFHVKNRITWEREKGRGAKTNWKNNTEDIWFCTNSKDYYFNVDAVKLKRKVIAPYRVDGKPKDWVEEGSSKYRLTHPSNIWTDITIPFWSMAENTSHPTQKSEKLIAKLVMASSQNNDFVFDPFLGSGTTASVCEKLGRQWLGMDINREYLCWALKRIKAARTDRGIQGYKDGIFWERNSLVT